MSVPAPKTFSIFQDVPLLHAYSTRIGGISQGVFSSLNLGLHTKDNSDHVRHNRQLFFDYLNIDAENMVFPQQVHSANVSVVKNPGVVADADALVTAEKGLILTIQTADCFPVFIYDPQRHVCAVVHSGWRGTAAGIAAKTVSRMAENFNCQPGDLLVAIGAGIQQQNYQVDKKTAAHFDESFLKPDGSLHYRLDVQGAITNQLHECGVTANHIEADTTCTYEAEDLYYSYRRDGENSGRMMGVIGLL